MGQSPRTLRRALLLGGGVGLMAAIAAVVLVRHDPVLPTSWPVPGERGGHHVRVEVLNGSGIDGLARTVTLALRRGGLDVVFFGTAGDPVDSTLLLVRRGDSAVAEPVRRVLGVGRIEIRPDARLLLDVSVILGADARAVGRDP